MGTVAKDIGPWQELLCRMLSRTRYYTALVIPAWWTTTSKCTEYKEPPYAERHVRWCERSENESRKKTFVFLLLDYLQPQKNDLESYISNVFNCFVYVEIVYAGSGFLKIIRNLEAVFLTIIIKNIK